MIINDHYLKKDNCTQDLKVGVIILNWNNWQDTSRCIEYLHACTYSRLEIWVVDNGSQDESIFHLSKLTGINILPLDLNLGFAASNNIGIQAALDQNCDYILLLNNDTELPPDFLQPLLEPFVFDPRAGITCPKILYKEPQQTIWYAGGKFHQPRILGELIGMGKIDQGQYNHMMKTDFAVGTCMLIKRDIFTKVGMLDDRFFFFHEDVDFCYRAIHAGFNVWYQPKSSIVHRVSTSTREKLDQRVFLYERARVVFLFKHVHGFKIPIVIFMEIIRLLRAIFNGMMHKHSKLTISYLKGLIAGLKDGRMNLQ